MRAAGLLFLLFVLALVCVAARGQDGEDQIPVRVHCDGARVAVLQFVVREPGVYTLALPPDICGRSASRSISIHAA